MLLAALAPAGAAAASPDRCFWEPFFTRNTVGDPEKNFAYPDTEVSYWGARFNLPAEARMVLRGYYSHSRYQSVNAYISGAPSDTLRDVQIRPQRGSVNPFVPGHRRDLKFKKRRWKMTVLDAAVPAGARKPNTIYASANGGVQELLYRVYLPDRGTGVAGGVPVPSMTLILEDGRSLTGSAACALINNPVRTMTPLRLPQATFESMVNTPGAKFETAPAFSPPRWERFFNFAYALGIFKEGTPSESDRASADASDTGGQYSNGDARYIMTAINDHYGKVLVLRAKMPTFPRTWKGSRRAGSGQVRYWSLCENESPLTTSVIACLYDEQVPLTRKRRYTIVVSTAANRPRTATRKCGVAWLKWGNYVDSLGRGGTGTLIMRNLIASPKFKQAIQNIHKPGQESAVMGPYMPKSTYMDKADFVAPRCRN